MKGAKGAKAGHEEHKGCKGWVQRVQGLDVKGTKAEYKWHKGRHKVLAGGHKGHKGWA